MKGLLYKDYLNGRGGIYLVICYAPLIYSILVSLGSNIRMAESLEAKLELYSEAFIMPFFFISFLCVLPLLMAFAICAMDTKTKWTNYAMALPGGYKMVVAEKYIILGIAHVCGFLMGLSCLPIVKSLYCIKEEGILIESNIEMLLVTILLMVGASMTVSAFLVPMTVRGVTWIEYVITGIMVIILYGGLTYAAFGDLSFLTDAKFAIKVIQWFLEHKNIIWVFGVGSVAGGILCQVISYLLTKKMFLKLVG